MDFDKYKKTMKQRMNELRDELESVQAQMDVLELKGLENTSEMEALMRQENCICDAMAKLRSKMRESNQKIAA